MSQKFIAYQGDQFTIEWYFDSGNKSKPLEYFEKLTFERQKKTLQLFKLIANRRIVFNEEKFRHEGDQVYAIKPSPDRFLCFFYQGSKIIITNAYEKKTSKMPIREKDKALNAREDYIRRCKQGNYYD